MIYVGGFAHFPLNILHLRPPSSRAPYHADSVPQYLSRMADDDSSELSSLSSLSPVPSEDESDVQLEKQNGILRFFHKLPKKPPAEEAASSKEPSPPPRKREPSPPHEYTLADNPDIAVRDGSPVRVCERSGRETSRVICGHRGANPSDQLIVMFRNKFTEAFPKSFPNFGPQDIEHEVCEALPGDRVELLLCALLGLLRNRKQDVK